MIDRIGNKIVELRKMRNISQEELAEKVGVTRQAISKWERGEGLPDLYNTIILAEVFNISLDKFILDKEIVLQSEIRQQSKTKNKKLLIIGSFLGLVFIILGMILGYAIIGPRIEYVEVPVEVEKIINEYVEVPIPVEVPIEVEVPVKVDLYKMVEQGRNLGGREVFVDTYTIIVSPDEIEEYIEVLYEDEDVKVTALHNLHSNDIGRPMSFIQYNNSYIHINDAVELGLVSVNELTSVDWLNIEWK